MVNENNVSEVDIFTDGGCRGNPGPGGWGAILRFGDNTKEMNGFVENTTNNQMELMAAIQAFEALKRSCIVNITTDSKYVKNGITKWIKTWKVKGWQTASRKEVKNKDLWQRLDKVTAKHKVKWEWVKGHSGHTENERVDALVNEVIDKNLISK